jgi:hypothetical protein
MAAPPVRLEATARVGLPAEEQPSFDAAVAEAARRGAAEAGVAEQADASATLVIDVAWKDERRIDYVGRIEVRGSADGAIEPLAIRSFGCEMCGASDLMARLQREVALALGSVTWPAPEPVTEPEAAASSAPADDAPEPGQRVRLHPLGWAGVGTASTGVVAITVGAVLWSRGDRLVLRPEDPEGPVWKRSFRPPGIGLVVGGAAAVVVGGALLAVDLVRGRRRSVAMQPVLGRGLTGLAVEGRF